MIQSVHEEVLSKIEVSGASVEIVDYEWHSGDSIRDQEDRHRLRWRVFPSSIGVSPLVVPAAQKAFGRLMFFPADSIVHTDRADIAQRSRCITCRFDQRWFSEVANLPRDWRGPDLIASLDISNFNIDQVIQRLGVEASRSGHASRGYTQALAEVLAIEVARHFLTRRSPKVRARGAVLSLAALQTINDYVSANADRNISVAELAALCCVSESHLSRTFKSTTGQTVHAFVTDIRLQKAKTMLATDVPLKVLSHKLGFSDASAFSTAFRKICGETPSAFRARLNS